MGKVDPRLFAMVNTCSKKSNNLPCVIYASDYLRVKSLLSKSSNIKADSFYEYPFIKAFGVKLKPNVIKKIAKFEHVKYITAGTKVFAQIDVAKKIIKADKLHYEGYFGSGVTIAIIDTGISNHLDFVCPTNRITIFKDFVNSKKRVYDDNGHGTFVAGVACGSGLVSKNKYSGIAPKSNIISLKTLDKNGETGAFIILQAMQWVFDNYKKYNIKVVCMSFGSNPLGGGDPLTMGAEALWRRGITVVAAAGNSGPDAKSIMSPGISPRIITVGALDDKRDNLGKFIKENFDVADFSSRGPAYSFYKPDILAPGVNLTSTSVKNKEFYTVLSGTSVATPIIAGLVCLLIEKYPSIKPDEIKGILIKNSYPIINDRNSEGYGLIDGDHLLDD